jgi:YVTN family beta-propeller protein
MRIRTIFFAILFVSSELFAVDTDPVGDPAIHTVNVAGGQTLRNLIKLLPAYTQVDIDPGRPPEGDYLGWAAFTRDGSRVLVTNRMTDNVTVFNWSTMAVIANIPVGDYPTGIAVNDSFAVVPCVFSDNIYIIRLSNLTVDTILTVPAGQQPMMVQFGSSGNRIYVACDISNTCEIFDLPTMSHVRTISNFPFGIMTYTWNSENGRNSFKTTNYAITPGDSFIVVSGYSDTLFYINTATGNRDYQLLVTDCPTVSLSGDGTKTIALSAVNPAVIYRIDNATHAVTGTVTVSGYTLSFYDVAVNQDGSKAFIATSNNTSAIVRFATNDFTIFSSTYSAFWIGVSPDHTKAISGQYRFSIIDFASESMLGQYAGNSQYTGAVSPVGTRAIGYDEHRFEGVYFYDYATATPVYRGATESGAAPEGDGPLRVAITPNGTKAVVMNTYSDNASILNLATLAVDTILPIGDRCHDVAITSDSRWAVACGFNSSTVSVIDLVSNTVVAVLSAGSGSSTVSLSPGDSFAYVGNIGSNTVTKIRLAGASSYVVANIPCGEIGLVWAAYGVSSGVRASPNGRDVLVAVSFVDSVQVINTATNSIVAELPVGDFPLEIAFDSSGNYAIVTNAFANTYSVLYVNGASSSVIGTYSGSQYPLRLAYNQVLDQTGIGYYTTKSVVHYNPRTGAYIGTDSYSSYGSLIQVIFDELGEPIVLTSVYGSVPGNLHRSPDVITLPATPGYFDYCPVVQKAVVVMPGPDYATVIDWSGTFVKDVTTISLRPDRIIIRALPNPSRDRVEIKLIIDGPRSLPATNRAGIYDLTGQLIRSLAASFPVSERSVSYHWDRTDDEGRNVASGIYFFRVEIGGISKTARIVLVK